MPQDYAEAVRLFRKDADQGDSDAQYNLGLIYTVGSGVPQDYVLAHVWLSRTGAKLVVLLPPLLGKALGFGKLRWGHYARQIVAAFGRVLDTK